MSLEHDFLLVSAAEHSPADYMRLIRHPDATRVHDDLLRYIGDSLRWIPTLNPAKNEHGFGLNFWGPTAVLGDGAALAAAIFRTWASLFRLGPDELVLTGPWTQIEGEPNSGHFARLRLSRDRVCDSLTKIASDCDAAAASGGARFVAHFGV